MATKAEEIMSDREEVEVGDELSAEDQAYFESGGEVEPEAPPEQEGQPEAQPDTKEEEPERQKTVPHGAFHEERERRKAAEERATRIEARLDQMLQRIPAQEPDKPTEQAIDPQADPMGALDKLWQQQQEHQQRQQQESEARRQQEAARAVVQDAHAEFATAKAERPELDDAYKTVIEGRYADLQALGLSPAEAAQAVQREELGIIQTARQRGIPMAHVVDAMARQRGWSPKPATPEIDNINKAATAARSLSQGGGTPAGTVTAKDIDAMDDDEFAAWMEQHPKQAREYLGG